MNIEEIAAYYGNRRTVVHAFLTDQMHKSDLFQNSELSVFEIIELRLSYPIPRKIKAQLNKSKNQ